MQQSLPFMCFVFHSRIPFLSFHFSFEGCFSFFLNIVMHYAKHFKVTNVQCKWTHLPSPVSPLLLHPFDSCSVQHQQIFIKCPLGFGKHSGKRVDLWKLPKFYLTARMILTQTESETKTHPYHKSCLDTTQTPNTKNNAFRWLSCQNIVMESTWSSGTESTHTKKTDILFCCGAHAWWGFESIPANPAVWCKVDFRIWLDKTFSFSLHHLYGTFACHLHFAFSLSCCLYIFLSLPLPLMLIDLSGVCFDLIRCPSVTAMLLSLSLHP